jgi:type I restriction-modification system DNA methylase subunit
VPPEARWSQLEAQAEQATIGQLVDDAMAAIERDNPALKGVLPKDYARPALDKTRLGQLIDMISNIKVGEEDARARDVLGRVYEYFLSQFASAEGKKGGVLHAALRGQAPGRLLARDRKDSTFRDRRGEILFIDAHKLGRMVDRTHRELADEDIALIAGTYHAWRGEQEAGEYADVPGFRKSATLEEVRGHGHVLTPGRYVAPRRSRTNGERSRKMKRLTATLREQQAEAARLDAAIAANLREHGFGGEQDTPEGLLCPRE